MIYMVFMAMCDLCGPQIGLASSGGTLRNQIQDERGCLWIFHMVLWFLVGQCRL